MHFGDGTLLVDPARWFRTLLVDPAWLRTLSSNQPRPPTGQRWGTFQEIGRPISWGAFCHTGLLSITFSYSHSSAETRRLLYLLPRNNRLVEMQNCIWDLTKLWSIHSAWSLAFFGGSRLMTISSRGKLLYLGGKQKCIRFHGTRFEKHWIDAGWRRLGSIESLVAWREIAVLSPLSSTINIWRSNFLPLSRPQPSLLKMHMHILTITFACMLLVCRAGSGWDVRRQEMAFT